jgi:hypothetical protein
MAGKAHGKLEIIFSRFLENEKYFMDEFEPLPT